MYNLRILWIELFCFFFVFSVSFSTLYLIFFPSFLHRGALFLLFIYFFNMFTKINQYQETLNMLILDCALFPLCNADIPDKDNVLWKFWQCLIQRIRHTIYPLARLVMLKGLYLRIIVSQFSFFIFFAFRCNHKSNAFHLFRKMNTNTYSLLRRHIINTWCRVDTRIHGRSS